MKRTVMVVDDSLLVFHEMKNILNDTDYEIVSHAKNGEEAIEIYGDVQPDVVTMDIIMPGMDGIDTAKALLAKWPDAKILMISSLAYDDVINESRDVGVCGFVYKPIEKEHFVTALNKIFD